MAVTMKQHDLTHAPRSLFLPSHIPVRTKIVTHSRTTSGRVSVPKTSDTWHDTGNPRTNADGEWAWLAGGRQGGSLGGYNAIVDDQGVIYCGYLDWETWHAGVTSGNLFSWGTEMAFGAGVVWTTAFEYTCAWHGALMEMGGLDVDRAFRWHKFWTGKYCPGQIFNRGLESIAIAKIKSYWQMSRTARLGGTVVEPPITTYAKAMPPMVDGKVWDGLSDVVLNNVKFEAQKMTAKTLSVLNKRQFAGTDSLLTGPAYAEGVDVDLLGWVAGEMVDGISEWAIDTDGNRLWAGGLDFEPKVDPEFGEAPEDAPGLIPINGRIYYPLMDEETGALGRYIDIFRDGELRRWASTDPVQSPVTGVVTAGTKKLFRYWTRGEELPLTFKDGTEATESIWYAEDLHAGNRMWSGLSSERPD